MATKQRSKIDIDAAARRLLDFPSLRPGQKEAIESVLEGHDTLVVQPTGHGKSAIYQIAGDLLRGATIVISPLIALQKDQSDSIRADGLKEPAVLNSHLPAAARRETIERIEDGEVQYIFLAPEQLRNRETIGHLQMADVSLFVVDEAHCISQWGHDFRPDYLQLATAIDALGNPTTLAMTATASPRVRDEITAKLRLRTPRVFVHGFDRPNISLRVDKFSSESEKYDALIRRVSFAETPGIVYTATHKAASTIASDLQQQQIDAVFYHAGLKPQVRADIQERFMAGESPIIAATNAFGMGIDKPDVRFVFHADVSDSLDAYYQEIGRAGRDGEPAEAVLFFRSNDIGAQKYRTSAGSADSEDLEQIASVLAQQEAPASPELLSQNLDISARKLLNSMHRLEDVGAVEQLPSGEFQLITEESPAEIAQDAAQQQEIDRQNRRERLAQMQAYAECRSCRREFLLRYFGEDYTGPCGNCDNCEAAGALPAEAHAATHARTAGLHRSSVRHTLTQDASSPHRSPRCSAP